MKYSAVASAAFFVSAVLALDGHEHLARNQRHAAWRARQAPAVVGGSSVTTPVAKPTSAKPTVAPSVPAGGSTTAVPSTPAATPTGTIGGNSIPPLASIVSNMPVQAIVPVFTTFAAGATPPVSGAPPLPSINIIPANYPALDIIPPTNTPEVTEWLKLLQGKNIPNIAPTTGGTCDSATPAQIAGGQANGTCWWTCGGCLRETDISVCPTKDSWGVSYDDGPSDYTAHLLNYLNQQQLHATFFTVGSRVISRPAIVQAEYMIGHEIAAHTWSHPPLTSLTNEQIVAEMGWTVKAIKDVIGVTPRYMRPPYGDIDDRVRAVLAAMNLIPIMWTGSGVNEFDTDDWMIPGGTATGTSSLAAFQRILALAQGLTTGFIVLEHDLYQQTVDMAIGYFLPLAKQQNFKLSSILQCLNTPLSACWVETYQAGNGTTTGNSTVSVSGGTGATGGGSASPQPSSGTNPTTSASVPASVPRGAVAAFAATVGLLALGGLAAIC